MDHQGTQEYKLLKILLTADILYICPLNTQPWILYVVILCLSLDRSYLWFQDYLKFIHSTLIYWVSTVLPGIILGDKEKSVNNKGKKIPALVEFKFFCMRVVKSESVSHSVISNYLLPINCNPPGSSVHGILQARRLEWIAIPFSRGSSQHRDRAWVSCIAGRFFITWATKGWWQAINKISKWNIWAS